MTTPTSLLGLLFSRLKWMLLVQTATLVVSTIGFVVFASLNWFDALYMSVITLGTVGYGEITPLDAMGRSWAIVIIVIGFAVLVYSAAVLTSLFVSDDLKSVMTLRKRARLLHDLKDHIIVVGFGRVGRSAVHAVINAGHVCAVVDANAARQEAIEHAGAVPIIGDGMQEDVIRHAGIGSARALVAAGPDDPTNLVVTLTARALRPDLRIVTRVNEPEWQQRISRAGASAALSPYGDFGVGLAASALGADFVETHSLDGHGLRTEDVILGEKSVFLGRRTADLAQHHRSMTFIAMRRPSTELPWEKTDEPLRAGDLLVVVGPDEIVSQLEM